jgi:hypothetical protein
MRAIALFPRLLASACVLAGCASHGSMDAAYEQSLAPWKGAPRARLVAQWGTPNLEQRVASGDTVLVYVVHHELESRMQPPTYAVIGSGGRTTTVVTPATNIAPAMPVTCTTHFVLKDDVVASWSFEGLACGAPQ